MLVAGYANPDDITTDLRKRAHLIYLGAEHGTTREKTSSPLKWRTSCDARSSRRREPDRSVEPKAFKSDLKPPEVRAPAAAP